MTTDPLFLKENGQYYFYHNDHLGTPQKLTVVNGAVVWGALYSSFGKATVEIETVENNLRFPGQYYDSETGLHYNWNRYYDPKIGRYLRVDPVGTNGGLNLYSYADFSPIKHTDIYGLYVVTPQFQKCIKGVEKRYKDIYEKEIEDYCDCIKGCNDIDKFECKKDKFIVATYKLGCNLKCSYKFKRKILPYQLKMWRDVMVCYELYQAPTVYPIEPHDI